MLCEQNNLDCQKMALKLREGEKDSIKIAKTTLTIYEQRNLFMTTTSAKRQEQMQPRAKPVMLRHSFYFYFYFEHLNFTWSYLIDLLIISILSWRSYLDDLRSYLDLLILSDDDDPRYISFTLLLTCIWHAFDSCLSFTIDMHSTHVAAQHAFTTCFTRVCLEDNTWTLVYKP